MSEQLDERLRTAARTYRRLGNQSAESMFLEAADTICKIQAENEKLRDFVYDMWNDMNVYYTQNERPDSSDMDFYRDRMRELGIEVQP